MPNAKSADAADDAPAALRFAEQSFFCERGGDPCQRHLHGILAARLAADLMAATVTDFEQQLAAGLERLRVNLGLTAARVFRIDRERGLLVPWYESRAPGEASAREHPHER